LRAVKKRLDTLESRCDGLDMYALWLHEEIALLSKRRRAKR